MTPQEDELLALQFAAIMTASVQNTDSTIRDRIDRKNPCWTQAYADVCIAVDREMRERKRAEKVEAKYIRVLEALEHIARYPVHSEPMGGALDMQDIAIKALESLKT